MVALYGEDAQGGLQHLEVFPGCFRTHAALPGVAVGVVPQQEDHVRLGLHDFFHVPARLVAAVRAQVEVSGDHDPERGAPPFSFHCGTSSAVVTVSTRLGSTCHAHMNKEKPIISIETEMIASLLRRG